jgi:glycoprotein endo-alpha-1,2-mannosidase
LPSDYYLWQTGQAAKMLRKEIILTKKQPIYPTK